jgi:RHS repeat-associated protein
VNSSDPAGLTVLWSYIRRRIVPLIQVTSQYYDANGNVGGWTYSVENRLTVQVLDYMTGNENVYAYDPSGNRVMSGNDPTPDSGPKPQYTYTFYGITGQALARLTCNGSNYPSYPTCAIMGQNVYFGGKLIVAGGVNVVTDRLGSVRANGLGESFAYYPYGEERSSTVDGREKFGTYFRDGVGQDYADQRYYAVGSGRFWSVDPSLDNIAYANSTTWNAYAYANGDPVNFDDPEGLFACGQIIDNATGTTVSSVMTTYNDLGYLAQTVWHEGGPVWKTDLQDIVNFGTQQAYIATALENRCDIANGNIIAYTKSGGTVNPAAFGGPGTTLTAVILQAAGNNQSWGIYTGGQLNSQIMSTLMTVLNTDVSAGTQVDLPTGGSVNAECYAVLSAVAEATYAQLGLRTEPSGVTLAYWNLARNMSPDPANTQTVPKISPNGDTFYGYFATPQPQPKPVRRPPPIRPRPR